MRIFLLVPLVLFLASSCADKKAKQQDKEGATTNKAPSTTTTPTIGAKSEDAGSAQGAAKVPAADMALPEVPDVLPLTAAQVAAPRVPAAKASNTSGVRAKRSGDFKVAIEHFKQSLTLDPGALLPRYNLACALVAAGEPGQGLSLLQQFRDVPCEGCRERLTRARTEKDWEGLWNDDEFKRIVAPLVAANEVGVAYYNPRFPETLKKASFTLRPRLVLDRAVGESALPEFTLVLRDSQKEVARSPFPLDKRKDAQLVGKIRVPGIGRFALDLVAGDRVYESRVFAVQSVLCLGGVKRFEFLDQSLAFDTSGGDHGETEYFEIGADESPETLPLLWSFPLPGDKDHEYLAIWKHNGRIEIVDGEENVDTFEVKGTDPASVESEDQGYPYQDSDDGLCATGRSPIEIDASIGPGNWVLGLYSQHGASYEIRYSLRRGGFLNDVTPTLRTLSKPPTWTKKHFEEFEAAAPRAAQWDGKGKAMSTRLVRAAIRSAAAYAALLAYEKSKGSKEAQKVLALAAKHGGPWKKSELPTTMEWPARAYEAGNAKPAKGKCLSTACDGYPAISPDGKFVVTYQPEEIVFWDEEDECGRPEGYFLRVHEVATEAEVGSKDLSDYLPMDCTSESGPLEAGFRGVIEEDEDSQQAFSIKNSAGKTVKKADYLSSGFDYCTSPGKRVVVTQEHEGITHCHEAGTNAYEMLPY